MQFDRGRRRLKLRHAGKGREKLASISGIDLWHMGFIEQGRRKTTLSTLYKVSEALDISLEQLFKGL